jgi:hypothetical protein
MVGELITRLVVPLLLPLFLHTMILNIKALVAPTVVAGTVKVKVAYAVMAVDPIGPVAATVPPVGNNPIKLAPLLKEYPAATVTPETAVVGYTVKVKLFVVILYPDFGANLYSR